MGNKRNDVDINRRRNEAISRTMRRRAQVMTCPACGRGNALTRRRAPDGMAGETSCRWCPFVREWAL